MAFVAAMKCGAVGSVISNSGSVLSGCRSARQNKLEVGTLGHDLRWTHAVGHHVHHVRDSSINTVRWRAASGCRHNFAVFLSNRDRQILWDDLPAYARQGVLWIDQLASKCQRTERPPRISQKPSAHRNAGPTL